MFKPSFGLPKDFFDVHRRVYAGDAKALAENPLELQGLFSSSNPFFENGSAWVEASDRVRLAGFVHPTLAPGAFFGFWEASGSEAAPNVRFEESKKFFSQLEEWARAQGAKTLWGPINFSTFGNYRVRLDGFERPPFYGEPWNDRSYAEILKMLGFECRQKYVSYFSENVQVVRSWARSLKSPALLEATSEFKFLPLTEKYFNERVNDLWDLTNIIFSENLAFAPVSLEVFKAAYGTGGMLKRMCPETSMVVEHKNGDVAGFCLNFPDYSPLLKKTSSQNDGGAKLGNDIYFQDVSFERHFSLLQKPSLLVKTAGFRKEYRRQGLPFLRLISEIVQKGTAYDRFCLCLMREGNFPSLLMKDLVQDVVNYGLFAKDL